MTPEELHALRAELLRELGGIALDCKDRALREIRAAKASPEGTAALAAVRYARTAPRTEADLYELLIVVAGQARRKTRAREDEE